MERKMPTREEWERKLLETFEIEPDAAIEPALLEVMGVPSDSSQRVRDSFAKNGILTWRDLESLNSRVEAQTGAEDEIRGSGIWDTVQDYKRKAGTVTYAGDGSKRIKLITKIGALVGVMLIDKSDAGVDGFLVRVFIEKDIRWDAPIVELEDTLFGMSQAQTFVLPRHVQRAHNIAERYNEESMPTLCHTVIAGTKGVGKSLFGLFVLSDLLRIGRVVTLEIRGEAFLIISANAWENSTKYSRRAGNLETNRETLLRIFKSHSATYPVGPGIYHLSESSDYLRHDLNAERHFINFIDADIPRRGGYGWAIISQGSALIVVSSADSGRLKRFGVESRYYLEVLEPWSIGDMERLNEALRDSAHSGTQFSSKDSEELDSLVNLFGGIPREVFQNVRSYDTALKRVTAEVRCVSLEQWRAVLPHRDITNPPQFLPGTLVHILPSNDPRSIKMRFASPKIASLIIENFKDEQRLELLSLIKTAYSDDKDIAPIRVLTLEERVHERFVAGLNSCQLIRLRWDEEGNSVVPSPGDFLTLSIPKLQKRKFKRMDMSDLTSFQPGYYYQPDMRNFPGVDGLFLATIDGVLCICGVRSTVSRFYGSKIKQVEEISGEDRGRKNRKETLRTTLTNIRDRVRTLTKNPTLPLFLVFVTTPTGINRAQKLGNMLEVRDREFQQFSLRVDWFTEILEAFDLSEPSTEEQEAAIAADAHPAGEAE